MQDFFFFNRQNIKTVLAQDLSSIVKMWETQADTTVELKVSTIEYHPYNS